MKKKIYFKTDTGFIVREAEWDMTSTQMGELVEKVKKKDPSAKLVKPVEVIVSGHNPLSNQCVRLTGDHYHIGAWNKPFGDMTDVILHSKTGLYVQVYNLDSFKNE